MLMDELLDDDFLLEELLRHNLAEKHMNDFTTGHNLEILQMLHSVVFIRELLQLHEH